MKKTVGLLIVGLCVVVLAGIGYVLVKKAQAPTVSYQTSVVAHGVVNGSAEGAVVVTLTKEGFSPDEITLKKGQTILFKNTTGNLYWPASNLHPSHLLYPEFDPQGPISPTDTWSFTFDKTGEWKFHDHLSPYFTGTITVTE